jgi:hypothetical protein
MSVSTRDKAKTLRDKAKINRKVSVSIRDKAKTLRDKAKIIRKVSVSTRDKAKTIRDKSKIQFDKSKNHRKPIPAHIASTFSFLHKSITKFKTATKQKRKRACNLPCCNYQNNTANF